VTSAHSSIYRFPEALNYLKSRDVTVEEVEKFTIGYAKVIGIPEVEHPDKKRFLDETARGRKLENKIIFPFYDGIGRTIGLAGRSINTKEFKTFVTNEGKYMGFFFGLREALPTIYKYNKAFIVEGYFDLLAFSKVVPNVVASITSGLNDVQYEQLCFYCDKIICCFDDDEAGDIGREKTKQWCNVKNMKLPGYKDPAKALEVLKLKKFTEYVKHHIEMVNLLP